MKQKKIRHWAARELVLIGVFAAATKLSSLLIALAGGGMNPVSLIAKNLVFSTLLIVLLTKVPKTWTLFLFTLVSLIVSVCLMGGSVVLMPAALFAALLAELAVFLLGGFKQKWGVIFAVAVYDFSSKAVSLFVSFLFMRESPALIAIVIPIVLLGYLGSLCGLWFGFKTVGELKNAGFLR